MKSTTRAKLPILQMKGMTDWERWLTGHHESSPGVWLMIAKKGSALISVSYAEALEAALCHGWIDGQKQAHDSEAWLQKFTPRGARSMWSKINRAKAEQLIASGRMKPAGLRGDREREAERAVGERLPFGEGFHHTGRFSGRDGEEQEGEDLLRNAEQRQPVRDPLQDSDREEGGDPRPADRAIHRDAGEAREDPSMSGDHRAPRRHDTIPFVPNGTFPVAEVVGV